MNESDAKLVVGNSYTSDHPMAKVKFRETRFKSLDEHNWPRNRELIKMNSHKLLFIPSFIHLVYQYKTIRSQLFCFH